ncbi:zinc finger HIT domain-containing protein 3 [Amia ocellicauda]|uniref:zinc finger HIT domain-containing protein 3 n=1 Tax=Amia ocellicauda TaxID=2972642 RepID=UPI003463DA6F
MQNCIVCNEEKSKYRCPVCKIRYCSLGCYKKHKDDCVSSTSKEPAEATVSTALPESRNGSQDSGNHWSVDDLLNEDEQSDRVPLQQLKLLGDSEELKALLCNPHLRQLLLSVDKAGNKDDIMKAAMQEPLFVEFADHCLKITEPEEKENVSPPSLASAE